MLFGSFLFGTNLFGPGSAIATVYSMDRVVFDDFSLSDGSVMVLTGLEDSGPTRDIIGDNVPGGDGSFITNAFFRERKIVARGFVKQSTAALLDAELDTIRQALSAREGNLDVTDNNGTVKRYVATLDNYEELFADRQRYHVTICPFKASFVCKTPFGKARDYSSVLYTSMSTSGTVQSIVNSGTYKAEPVILLVFSAASSVTGITLANSTTGESISYTGSAAAGDVFMFCSENKQVLKNGSATTYSGAFPSLDVGANLVSTTITGSSFTLDQTTNWKLTYL